METSTTGTLGTSLPLNTALGLPPMSRLLPEPVDLWKWLALSGSLAFFLEWMLFGRRRRRDLVHMAHHRAGLAKGDHASGKKHAGETRELISATLASVLGSKFRNQSMPVTAAFSFD